MAAASLKFGTSGLRGLASDLNGEPAFTYTLAFVRMLIERGAAARGDVVYLGRDLRASSPAIQKICAAAVEAAGLVPCDCGLLPTPSLAAWAMSKGAPSVMVTGSHIPEDRNGLKFYRPDGEIDKADEARITRLQRIASRDYGHDLAPKAPVQRSARALAAYHARYLDFFGPDCLNGLTVGVYQHSSVARDLLVDLLGALGAGVIPLGRSETFIPVDTEALRPDDIALVSQWAQAGRFDAIVSTDGDADRPLVSDEKGAFVRGDLLGAIAASHLGARTLVTPVTSNSALETCGRFDRIIRTKVGSPHVIAGMAGAGEEKIAGLEANGGFLLGWKVAREGRVLDALPTRDAILPIIAVLEAVSRRKRPLSELAAAYHFRSVASGLLRNIAPERSTALLERLAGDRGFAERLLHGRGGVAGLDCTDGLKFVLANGETVHFRASGNAPELRCYVESDNAVTASECLDFGLSVLRQALTASDPG